MAVNSGKRARREQKETEGGYYSNDSFKEIHPLNYIQESYLNAIKDNTIIFGIGSAGVGKTHVAAWYAASELFHKRVEKLYLTRPNIETGRSLGFLPGDLESKYLPYLQPFDSIFNKSLGKGFYDYALKNHTIEPRPITHMRGSTFENSIVLIDEAQNMTKSEFKMVLSRIGKNCKIIVSGDPSQVDISDSGLSDAVNRLKNIKDIEVVKFLDSDIVRSKMCKDIIIAYQDSNFQPL